MVNKAGLSVLLQELEGDVRILKRIAGQNEQAWKRIQAGAAEPIDWGALGYTLHALYGTLENYFLRVSKCFENALPADRWHKALVDKMRLDIPNLRPALFEDESDYRNALSLLKFRHRFRNLYGEDLDPGKTTEVQFSARELMDRFPAVHARFVEKLRAIRDGLP